MGKFESLKTLTSGGVGMNAAELKRYMVQDSERIVRVLEAANFHSIKIFGDEIRCAVPQGDNPTAVSIKLNDELFATSFTTKVPYHGDLLGLFQNVRAENFHQTMSFIHAMLGLSNDYTKPIQTTNLLDELTSLYQNGDKEFKDITNKLYPRSILSQYIMLPHENIINEGIAPRILKRFDICFDPVDSRILFPHYDWKQTDMIAGITGRTTMNIELIEKLGVNKYFNYIKGYKKTANLYGWKQSAKTVHEKKIVIIFEAEKSVLKQHTFERGNGFAVSVGGHEVSDVQIKFLIENTSTDTEIVFAFDNDIVREQIDEFADQTKKFRKTSLIIDNEGLLSEKDAPIDKGYEVWRELFRTRTIVK